LARKSLLISARKRDERLAFADGDRRPAIVGNLDAIEPRTGQLDLGVRSVDAGSFIRFQDSHTHDHAATCEVKRKLQVVEARDMQIRVGGKAKLSATIIDLDPSPAGDPKVVARSDRIVDADHFPLIGAFQRREKEIARSIGDPADTSGKILVAECGYRYG
jgi:hypothetical protein